MPKNNSKFIIIIVLTVGFLISSLSSWFFYNTTEKSIIKEFQKEVNEYSATVYRELSIDLESLYAVSILFHSNSDDNYQRFDGEVKSIISRHPESSAFAWVPRIKHNQRAQFEEEHFIITNINEEKKSIRKRDKNEYFPVYHISPSIGNEKLFGFDISSDPNIFRALQKSMNTATEQATNSVILVQDRKHKKGFLTILPVYNTSFSTQKKRKEDLKGFVVGSYIFDKLFPTDSLEDEYDGIEIKIVDETLSLQPEVLKIHHENNKDTAHETIFYEKKIPEILGRQWTIVANPSKEYIIRKRGILPTIVFISGMLLTLFNVIYLLIISRRTKLKHELESRINEEVDKNQEKTNQLIQQSKLAQTGEMISMIAHQWRQPLTAITATANTISLQVQLYDQISNEELLKEISLISEYSQHLSSTIDDFRNFYKPNKEKEHITFEEILDKTINIIHSSFEEKSIELEKNYNCLKKVYIYPSQLSQVILNILKNAEDALVEQNIRNQKIIINTYSKEDSYILEINDNAGGVKEDSLDKIFDPYFSTKMKKDGTGLGLYMSKTIIEDHCHGKLEVENKNHGALFRIIIKGEGNDKK